MLDQERTYYNLGVSSLEDVTKKNYFSLFPEEVVASFLDAFIINLPMSGKVGGDGFWIFKDGEDLFIALFDCMGHGHLASMMTRVYKQSLQRVMESYETRDPGTILRYLHHKIATKFSDREKLQVGTGADIGLLKINLAIRHVEFAGAKVDLMHVKNGQMEIVKADRMQIGEMFEMQHTYQTSTIVLEEGVKSNLYLSSDGFRDLMGGDKNKKLGKKMVADVILEHAHKPILDQKTLLTTFIDEWKGSNDQPDDVLIMGFAL